MWLINVNTYRLEYFTNHDTWKTRPYAILSHTWEEDEVTFQDMQDLSVARAKRGFWKIEKTCKTSKHHDIEWAWVDTCCIDKTSSAELQEAINSMFAWYAKSVICYTYLADVGTDKAGKVDNSAFRKSRWFTRGWTLQELIAPGDLNFYGKAWRYLGKRSELKDMIASTTNIDVNILENGVSANYHLGTPDMPALAWSSVAKRMSWAAHRRTKRIEDRAYSLLGIFGVNMPLLYGEGNRAFFRLQEEILRTSPDLSLLLWEVDSPTSQSVELDEDGEDRDQGLLAFSPDLFASCRSLCPIPSERLIESAAARILSSIGVKTHLPVLSNPGEDVTAPNAYDMLVLLNCSDELDPTHTVALRAQWREESLLQLTNSAATDANQTLYLYLPSWEDVTKHRVRSRTERIDFVVAKYTVTTRDVVLLRSAAWDRSLAAPASLKRTQIEGTSGLSSRYTQHVWLRLDFPSASPPWSVKHTYPRQSWRLQPIVFDVTKSYSNVICIEWRGEEGTADPVMATYMVGGIVLQRHDLDHSTVAVALACLVDSEVPLPEVDAPKDMVIHVSSQALEAETINETWLLRFCHSMKWRICGRPCDHRRYVNLYESTQLWDASDFSIVWQGTSQTRTMLTVLHAFDTESLKAGHKLIWRR